MFHFKRLARKSYYNEKTWIFSTRQRIKSKNWQNLKAVDLSKQKELDADPKAILQIVFVAQLKNVDSKNADETESLIVLKILDKIKETRLKFSQGSVTVL